MSEERAVSHAAPRAGVPRCPFCREEIEDDLWTCPSCHTPHHGGCAKENGHCTVFGCTWTLEEPRVVPATAPPVAAPEPEVSAPRADVPKRIADLLRLRPDAKLYAEVYRAAGGTVIIVMDEDGDMHEIANG